MVVVVVDARKATEASPAATLFVEFKQRQLNYFDYGFFALLSSPLREFERATRSRVVAVSLFFQCSIDSSSLGRSNGWMDGPDWRLRKNQ